MAKIGNQGNNAAKKGSGQVGFQKTVTGKNAPLSLMNPPPGQLRGPLQATETPTGPEAIQRYHDRLAAKLVEDERWWEDEGREACRADRAKEEAEHARAWDALTPAQQASETTLRAIAKAEWDASAPERAQNNWEEADARYTAMRRIELIGKDLDTPGRVQGQDWYALEASYVAQLKEHGYTEGENYEPRRAAGPVVGPTPAARMRAAIGNYFTEWGRATRASYGPSRSLFGGKPDESFTGLSNLRLDPSKRGNPTKR